MTFSLVAGWDNWPTCSLVQAGSLSQAAGSRAFRGKIVGDKWYVLSLVLIACLVFFLSNSGIQIAGN